MFLLIFSTDDYVIDIAAIVLESRQHGVDELLKSSWGSFHSGRQAIHLVDTPVSVDSEERTRWFIYARRPGGMTPTCR